MRKLVFTVAAAAALGASGTLIGGGVEAAPIGAPHALQTAVDSLDVIENVQFVFGGRRFCWYDDGWQGPGWYWCGYRWRSGLGRSEEHTSELQSRGHLVCRLLLQKKKRTV